VSNKWVSFLKFIAWLNVIISVIAAVIILVIYTGISPDKSTNWIAVGVGIGLLLESFFVLALVMVFCFIAEKLSEISYHSEKLSNHFIQNKKESEKWECPKCRYRNLNNTYVCNSCGYSII